MFCSCRIIYLEGRFRGLIASVTGIGVACSGSTPALLGNEIPKVTHVLIHHDLRILRDSNGPCCWFPRISRDLYLLDRIFRGKKSASFTKDCAGRLQFVTPPGVAPGDLQPEQVLHSCKLPVDHNHDLLFERGHGHSWHICSSPCERSQYMG